MSVDSNQTGRDDQHRNIESSFVRPRRTQALMPESRQPEVMG